MSLSSSILEFLSKGKIAQEDNLFYCQSRDQSSSRLSSWMKYLNSLGLSFDKAAILIAIIGEITNNCFDHNLGQWNEVPGCLVSFKIENNLLIITIADRGQGIINSLERALNKKNSPAEILKKAFEERISGRAPEKRGNGLKFVSNHLQSSNNSLLCCSQQSIYSIGHPRTKLNPSEFPKDFGTVVCIEWSLK
jgi:hypothetical protein